MRKFGEILLSVKEYLILTLLVVLSLVMLFSNDNTQIRFLRAVAIGFFGTIQSGVSAIPNVFELESENQFLREKNIKLANEVATLKEARLENIRLSKLLELKELTGGSVVSASIVNKSVVKRRNTITLNVGEDDGVKLNMPVITDDGLVGKIVATSKSYSIAQILYNNDLKVTVKAQRSRVDGILTYDGVENLVVTNVPKSADVNVGDVVVTSEYSNTFPAGIPVGVVREAGNLDNLFKKILITPSVDFNVLEEVFVLKYLPNEERRNLEELFIKQETP